MALGIGLLFGYQLRQNFFTPYVAAGASGFWRLWHGANGTFCFGAPAVRFRAPDLETTVWI